MMNQLVLISYLTLVLDNMLLTMVVPILPDYLNKLENEIEYESNNKNGYKEDYHDKYKNQNNLNEYLNENEDRIDDLNEKKQKELKELDTESREDQRGSHKSIKQNQNRDVKSNGDRDFYRDLNEDQIDHKNTHENRYQIEDNKINYQNKNRIKHLDDQYQNRDENHEHRNIFRKDNNLLKQKEHQKNNERQLSTALPLDHRSTDKKNSSVDSNQSNAVHKMRSKFHPFNAYATRAHQTGNIGILLSTHGFLQFMFNGIAGHSISRLGHTASQTLGLSLLLLAAFVYSISEKFLYLVLARGLHGMSSSFIIISAMSMIAKAYNDEEERCIQMGSTMSGIGAGVLIGYPYGGIFYQLFGKCIPFFIFIICLLVLLAFQVKLKLDKNFGQHDDPTSICNMNVSFKQMLFDHDILTVVFTIGVSTMCIATLEPCLPIWLIYNFQPQKWQLGMAFIPDSIGYLLGTKYLSSYILYFGKWSFSKIALILVGCSTMMIPMVTSIYQLIIPHFILGLSIGAIDAAMMPLLAYIVDIKFSADYGLVYAIAQIAVCTAYGVAPLVGSQLADMFGFSWLMRLLGLLNFSQALLIHVLIRNNALISVDSAVDNNQLHDNFHKFFNRIQIRLGFSKNAKYKEIDS